MYHNPVMLTECLEGLKINPKGTYLDLTFGGGGHSRAILEQLDGGKLYSFDQDDDAVKNADSINNPSFNLIEANFRDVAKYLRLYGVTQVDGVLADLGVSSHQFDEVDRGFSFRGDAPLDMRMNQSFGKTASEVLNQYTEKDLHYIFGVYGEVRNAKTLAALIVKHRVNEPFKTTFQFVEVLRTVSPRGKEVKYFAQVFQALRLEVNAELSALEEMLMQMNDLISEGGRLVVMSYHSLEDRLVKNFINKGVFKGEPEKDLYGNTDNKFKSITRKPIIPMEEEIAENNRARSAKLRIAERVK